jgi:hypothetical protein
MPDLALAVSGAKAMGCDYSAIAARSKNTEAVTGQAVDAQKAYSECMDMATVRLTAERQVTLQENSDAKLVMYGIAGAVVAVVILFYLFRRPIRNFAERGYIYLAARKIRDKERLEAYQSEIYRRVRAKADADRANIEKRR